MTATDSIRDRARRWWTEDATHVIYQHMPMAGAPPMEAHSTYLRLWVTDLFVAKARQRAGDQYPAVRASARLSFAGSEQTFSTLVQATAGEQAPGIRSRRLTNLIPFCGGVVGIQSCLYSVRASDDIRLALDLLGGFTSLLMPQLTAIAGMQEQVAAGIDKVEGVMERSGQRAVLTLDREYTAAGPVGEPLRPGHIAVINAEAVAIDRTELSVRDGQLYHGDRPLDGYDYLVLGIETLRERDDWEIPEWTALIAAAIEARERAWDDRFRDIRQDLMAKIMSCHDLVRADRQRVAAMVRAELEQPRWGAAGDARPMTIAEMVRLGGLPDQAAVADLTLADLLS
jgi:hypothetical protein